MAMPAPTVIDVPHRLTRDEVKRRMRARIGELPGFIPGGMADVATSWPDEDRMAVTVTALGQRVAALLEVRERVVRVTLDLPPALAMFAGAIEGVVRRKGADLLLGTDAD